MKKKDKNLLLFTLFLTVLVVSLPSIMKGDSKETTNFGFNLEGSQVSWNVSEYDEFIGPAINTTSAIMKFRIYIRDDDPNYNWTKTEADFEWCTGSGTEGDPYIIENLYIDAQGEGGGMYIRNTDKYFVIRNCWINNSEVIKYGAAIFLEYAVNGNITDNIFTYTRAGIKCQYDCSDILISGNYVISDIPHGTRAISMERDCYNIEIFGNKILNCRSGMYFALGINNLTLRNNYITNTDYEEWEDPPVRFDEVNNSKVIYNTLDGVYAQTGVFVDVLGGTNNTVLNNSIISGDEFDAPDVPILSGNLKLSAQDKSAVSLDNCSYNLVAHNRILSSSDAGIPGYDTLFILSLFGIVFTVLIIKVNIKKSKV